MHERTPTPVREIDPYHGSVMGCYRNGLPFVAAGVLVPHRHDLGGMVNFMLDMSSDHSLLAPFDAMRLGCSIDDAPISMVIGWKGRLKLGLKPAVLVFQDTFQDISSLKFYNVHLGVVATEPGTHSRMPSILGRDVMRRCRIVMEPHKGVLRIVPKNPDLDNAKANAVRCEQQFRNESSDPS